MHGCSCLSPAADLLVPITDQLICTNWVQSHHKRESQQVCNHVMSQCFGFSRFHIRNRVCNIAAN
jgi:hypothetical protein